MKLIDKLFRDKENHLVIWQSPNPLLWTWIIAIILGPVLHNHAKTIVSTIGTLALALWAGLEIGQGESLFRRILGGVVLIAVLVGIGMKIRGPLSL